MSLTEEQQPVKCVRIISINKNLQFADNKFQISIIVKQSKRQFGKRKIKIKEKFGGESWLGFFSDISDTIQSDKFFMGKINLFVIRLQLNFMYYILK